MAEPPNIEKQEGTTAAERHLARLCSKSFLSLWSYPGVCRDQGKRRSGDGKEICDLLVVFGDDVLIFSDKDCHFPASGKLDLDWARWFRRAVVKSADQLWGAERWLRENPGRVFVDRSCSQRLPVPLPVPTRMRVHRVVVAHDAARRCREVIGGSGSLIIFPALTGDSHVAGPIATLGDLYESWGNGWRDQAGYSKTVLPFAVGDLDPSKGFIHVFDDTGLNVVLRELDTAPDFVAYLRDREQFIRSGRLLSALGEEELLAHYLTEVDGYGWRSFCIPDDPKAKAIIPEGEWHHLQKDPAWIARKRADEASYGWDKVIERFNTRILDGTSAAYPFAASSTQELAVRAMAREPRFHRRIFAAALGDFLRGKIAGAIAARVVNPIRPGSPYYIFLAVQPGAEEEYQDYRERRWGVGLAYLIEAKRKFTDAREVVVLATEMPGWTKWATEDLMYRGDEPVTPDEAKAVRGYVEEQGVLSKLGKPFRAKVLEYPAVPQPRHAERQLPAKKSRSVRNSPCPCGSGLEFKRCCLRR
jgi:hypothetical protein